MTSAEIWNVVILLVQASILIGQLLLSKKINNQQLTRKKGYFIIEESNYVTHPENQDRFRDKFNLINGRGIGFYVSGNSDVTLCDVEFSIDGINQTTTGIPYEMTFTIDKRFRKYVRKINLNESQLKRDYLDMVLNLTLKNYSGYKYTEIITMRFDKDENNDMSHFWTLSRYNMIFR